jgi:hypothetical protein
MIEAVHSGVDWLTCTLPIDAPSAGDWNTKALRYLAYVAKQGYEMKERSMLGYEGMACGNCFVGYRDTDYMFQWTGFHADDGFDVIWRPDLHISRIDVQTTVKYNPMPLDVAKVAYRSAMESNQLLPASRRRKMYIIVGSDGGDTFYLGSPSSDQRGRIYNKEVQSEDIYYQRTWRYEAVFRNNHATSIANHIYTSDKTKAQVCADVCAQWFGRRGVPIPWDTDTNATPLPLVRSLPTDIERKLVWLESQVKPTVALLCSLGFRDIVLTALGLSAEV